MNYFGLNSVDRQSYRRKDTDYVNSLKISSNSRFILFSELKLLTTKYKRDDADFPKSSINAIFLKYDEVESLLSNAALKSDCIYLGIGKVQQHADIADGLVSYFAINLLKVSFILL